MEPTLAPWNPTQTIAKSKITFRASTRILERFPITEAEVETLFDAEELVGGNAEELYNLCRQLRNVWQYVIFFHPKPDNLLNLLRENSFPDPVIKGILDAYTSEAFSSVVETLASCSNSGIPRVVSTDWTSRTVVSRNNLQSSDREVVLTLSTDIGVQKVQLSSAELEKLYWAVNEVQKSLDGLLER